MKVFELDFCEDYWVFRNYRIHSVYANILSSGLKRIIADLRPFLKKLFMVMFNLILMHFTLMS